MLDATAVFIRLMLYLNLMLLFGLPFFRIYSLRGVERSSEVSPAFCRLLAALALLGLFLSGLMIASLTASMSGVMLADIERSSLLMVLSATDVGTAWQVRTGALVMFLLISLFPLHRIPGWGWALSLLGGLSLSTMVWGGHGVMGTGTVGAVHFVANIIHLLAAGVWVAALFALTALLFRPHRRMSDAHIEYSRHALASFGAVGTIVVTLLLLTGLVNSWVLVGLDQLGALLTTLYGRLLLIKLFLFFTMLGLAAVNRFYMTPTLEKAMATGDHALIVKRLRMSLITETGCVVTILGLVAWLGTLAPPASGI